VGGGVMLLAVQSTSAQGGRLARKSAQYDTETAQLVATCPHLDPTPTHLSTALVAEDAAEAYDETLLTANHHKLGPFPANHCSVLCKGVCCLLCRRCPL
jgi:hypothetical protein